MQVTQNYRRYNENAFLLFATHFSQDQQATVKKIEGIVDQYFNETGDVRKDDNSSTFKSHIGVSELEGAGAKVLRISPDENENYDVFAQRLKACYDLMFAPIEQIEIIDSTSLSKNNTKSSISFSLDNENSEPQIPENLAALNAQLASLDSNILQALEERNKKVRE